MSTRFWSLVSLVAFLAAIGLWLEGNRRRDLAIAPAAAHPAGQPAASPPSNPASSGQLLTRIEDLRRTVAARHQGAGAGHPDPDVPHRLRNTDQPLDRLIRNDRAILLANALVDTARPDRLPVPESLRAGAEPGSYLVQAPGPVNDDFRSAIAAAGGRIASYIPNNTYLVRISTAGAAQLAASAAAILPFEPYYKLQPELLVRVLNQKPLAEGTLLAVTLFAEDQEAVREALSGLGSAIVAEREASFGVQRDPQFIVAPGAASLPALAALPGVQLVERQASRVLLNDVTRERLAIATDSLSTSNHLGLTGSNVWVNLNDSGVDGEHPALKLLNGTNRLFARDPLLSLVDTNGHGTHVAGIIAGDGAGSGTNSFTSTNPPPGSLTNANFRGMAPSASLFVLGLYLGLGPLDSDTDLQETAALTNYVLLGRTNAFISNNSWGYDQAFDYDSAAASYDAAVRDALADTNGMQPMLYVFAAGNSGFGDDDGSGGVPGSIHSPGTAKNVITVGATENLRPITMDVVVTNQVTNIVEGEFVVTNIVETNEVVIPIADSNDEVTSASSRGNVGLSIEGEAGRFKPDLVAPGAFLISTRSKDWTVDIGTTNVTAREFVRQLVLPLDTNRYSVLVPPRTQRLTIRTLPEPASPMPFPDLAIYARAGSDPTSADFVGITNAVIDLPQEGSWFCEIVNPLDLEVPFTLVFVLEVLVGDDEFLDLLREVNEPLEPSYRYDSGTSASAAAVSGMLALMQEFFEQKLKKPYSPALMKALLINGSRSLSTLYNLQVRPPVNYQGWGLPALTNIFPATVTNYLANPSPDADTTQQWPIRWVDQSHTNALATGNTHAYEIVVPAEAAGTDLRVTLVWTDPPGNPAASIKLVNDLDLVVSNTATAGGISVTNFFLGNDIRSSSDYVVPAPTNVTDQVRDNINNVENVFIRAPLNTTNAPTTFTAYVTGRRVNVNAVTAHTNAVVQDYALVVSVGGTNRLELDQLDLGAPGSTLATNWAELTVITNGVPILYQRAGANSPLLGDRTGTTNQWHFYAFINRFDTNLVGGETNFGQYVAFLTFVPPNLSTPRISEEGDIDLYVARSGDGGLTNLVPVSVARASKSLERGGSELVLFDDAGVGEVFYVGVKSEDQRSSEYGIMGLSSDEPFSNILPDGSIVMPGRPLPRFIYDGTPEDPTATNVVCIGAYPATVGRVIVTNAITHQDIGDLVGNLRHGSTFTVLNNHSLPNPDDPEGGFFAVYDDNPGTPVVPGSRGTDGPGSLMDFVGAQASGTWMFTVVDNAQGHTGRVDNFSVRVFPAPDLLAGAFVTLQPGQYEIFYVDVPPDAVLLRILLSQMTLPLDLFIRHGAAPTLTVFDQSARIPPPSGELDVGPDDDPPLRPGRYFVGLYNPNSTAASAFIQAIIERGASELNRRTIVSTNSLALGDDVRSVSTNFVGDPRLVADLKIGVRVDHPRVSDLAFYLVSPSGTRVLLNENRGGRDRTQYGFTNVFTNFHHVALTYSSNSGLAALYLDGAVQCEEDVGRFRPETRDHLALYLGRQPTTNAFFAPYLGHLDEVDLYDRALAPSEVLGIYKWGGEGKPTNSLLSRWPFDGSGQDAMTNHEAVLFGPQYVDPGKFGQALDFTGDGQYVLVTNALFVTNDLASIIEPSLDVGARGGLSLDAWINPDDLFTNRLLAAWSDGTNRLGVEFGLKPGGNTNQPFGLLYANLRDTSGSNHLLTAKVQGLIQTNAVITNQVFVTFTDDTNLAAIPIKFAVTGSSTLAATTNRLVSGFENAFATNATDLSVPRLVTTNIASFQEGDFIEGWHVDVGELGSLTALTAPPLAHTGTNLLVVPRHLLPPGPPLCPDVGTNLSLVTNIPTIPGTAYRLQFAHRRQPLPADIVGWWPMNCIDPDDLSRVLDVQGTNHGALVGEALRTSGWVYGALAFATNGGFVQVPTNVVLDLTNELSVEVWFRRFGGTPPDAGLVAKGQRQGNERANYGLSLSAAGVDLWFNDPAFTDTNSDLPGELELLRFSPLPPANRFHHLVGTFQQNTNNTNVELKLYLDGRLARHKTLLGCLTNAVSDRPLLLATDLLGADTNAVRGFNGVLDEVTLYSRALGTNEVSDLFWIGRHGKPNPPYRPNVQVRVGNVILPGLVPQAYWQTNAVTFQAESDAVRVELLTPTNNVIQGGVLFDSFELRELPPTHFLPEEALKPFIGESALGNWRLEAVDTRVGPEITEDSIVPTLIAWQLELIYAPSIFPVITLTNGVPYTNTIPVGQARYFVADVPFEATRATNILSHATNNLNLWFNQNGLPSCQTQFVGEVHLLTNATSGLAILGTNGTRLMSTNYVDVIADLAVPVLLPDERYYLALTNSGPAATPFLIQVDFDTLASPPRELVIDGPEFCATLVVTNTLQYYRCFIPTNATGASFELVPSSGNVDLYLNKDEPGGPRLPEPCCADYWSERPGLLPERITVHDLSLPLPLSPGDWYLGVHNPENIAATYCIRVRSAAPLPIETLANRGSTFGDLPARIAGLPIEVRYYRFTVAREAGTVTFVAAPFDGDVDLLVRRGTPWPDPTSFDYYDGAPGLAWNRVVVRPNSLPAPLRAGDWYFGVFNQEPFPVSYEAWVDQIGITLEPQVEVSAEGVRIFWLAQPGLRFQVQYANAIPASGPINWITLPGIITAPDVLYTFLDDGTLTGGLSPIRFYRLLLVP